MARMIIFDQEHWEKHPEDYPMVTKSHSMGSILIEKPVASLGFIGEDLSDGDFIIETDSEISFRVWCRVPKLIASELIRANVLLDIERPWLYG